MSSPCPSWPFPISRTTVEILVNPLVVSRANGSSSHRSIHTGSSATREYVVSVLVTPGWPSLGRTAIYEPRGDTGLNSALAGVAGRLKAGAGVVKPRVGHA